MKVTIEYGQRRHIRGVETFEDVIDLMKNIVTKWCLYDKEWRGR